MVVELSLKKSEDGVGTCPVFVNLKDALNAAFGSGHLLSKDHWPDRGRGIGLGRAPHLISMSVGSGNAFSGGNSEGTY